MIKLTLLSGAYAGRSLEFILGLDGEIVVVPLSAEYLEDMDVKDPMSLFHALLKKNWDWRVDYSSATAEEIPRWFRAELAARADRALRRGLPILFRNRVYRAKEQDVLEVLRNLEDEIVHTDCGITIESDDENGLVIREE